MKQLFPRFYQRLDNPITPWGRFMVLVLSISLALASVMPLWRISLMAPQYPEGLQMEIYSYTLKGGNDGHDIAEINELNHYIGMDKLDRSHLVDLDWIPFALGFLFIIALRAAALGKVRDMVDLCTMSAYVFGFSMLRFIFRLYQYGHNLDPHAAFRVQPFMPVVFGVKQVANFTTSSFPGWGSLFVGIYLVGIFGVTVWHFRKSPSTLD